MRHRRPAPPSPIEKCHICGARGWVPRSYVDPLVGMVEGKERRPCPKCTGIKPKVEGHFAVDDRRRVADMWRAVGLTCLHCAEGNF